MMPRVAQSISLSERLRIIADRVRNLPAPSRLNPEAWHLEKDSVAAELRKLSRIAQRKPL